jgi:putative ABC transport system ATP-binding protein
VAAILELRVLTREIAGRRIVDGVTFEVTAGELLALAGPSGAGKSSLLRLLNRLDEPTSGTILLDGRDYRELPARELRRRVGMVMQRPFLFPGTVADNLLFGPQQQGRSLATDEIDSILQRVGLAGFSAQDVSHLSGGEAQRVSFARALANGPEALLLDEPTSALDETSKAEVEAVIRGLVATGLTCVLVTHDLAQARRLAHRVALLDNGKLAKIGTVAEVLHA